jgi:mannose-6-phosphate isomerase-like protein (cupin superfamily)
MTEGKVWGQTWLIYQNETTSIHALQIIPGSFCSEHRHKFKRNIFYVLEGEIAIDVWTSPGQIDRTMLQAGQTATVEAGFWHKFSSKTGANILEIYDTRLAGEDIERRTVGGLLPASGRPQRAGD